MNGSRPHELLIELPSKLPVYLSPAMKVVVIIPAAGLGTRMVSAGTRTKKSVPSKQFTELGGIPILFHTLRKFAGHPRVAEILVVLRKDEIAGFRERLEAEGKDILQKKVQLIEGGSTGRNRWPTRYGRFRRRRTM